MFGRAFQWKSYSALYSCRDDFTYIKLSVSINTCCLVACRSLVAGTTESLTGNTELRFAALYSCLMRCFTALFDISEFSCHSQLPGDANTLCWIFYLLTESPVISKEICVNVLRKTELSSCDGRGKRSC